MVTKDTSDKFNAVPEDFVFLDEDGDIKQSTKVDKAIQTQGLK